MSSHDNTSNNNITYKHEHPEPEESELPGNVRRTRIKVAVDSGNLEELKLLVSNSEWYSIEDDFGHTLLQTAILLRNKAVFDFLLLSIIKYLDDDDGVTTLKIAFSSDTTEYFAIKLIESGVSINAICDEDQNTFLHKAVQRRFIGAAELLIKKGADINCQNLQGRTPLLMLVQYGLYGELNILDNFVSMLLYYGADVTICDSWGKKALERALNASCFDECVQNILENLIFYTLDGYSDYKSSVNVSLTGLFDANNATNPIFHQILNHLSVFELEVEDLKPDNDYSFDAVFLFFMELESLQLLIDTFPCTLSQILRNSSRTSGPLVEYYYNTATIKNFKLMLESDLCCDTIEFIKKIRIADIIYEVNAEWMTDLIYYLLTYGLHVYEDDLEAIYKIFGYCELFKILLHMDIKKKDFLQHDVIPAIIYDMSMDIDKFLEDPHNYSLNSLYSLLDYFALPKLRTLCHRINIKRLITKAQRLPQVPRLEEFARNAARKFVITKFKVKTSKEFYTIIKWLPIAENHRKIISFETKIYL